MSNCETVGAALAWATGEIAGDLDVRRYEAEILLQAVTGWSRARVLTSLQDFLDGSARTDFRSKVLRRVEGEPLQYIVGHAGFYGRLFSVRPGCLIPRPETEVLAESAIHWLERYRPNARVLDLGSGSGALAVTVALECSSAEVTAIDLSAEAVQITQDNVTVLGAQVSVEHGDGFDWLARYRTQVLLCNPPYIPSADIEQLAAEVRDREPRLALDGGRDGLDYYRQLAALGDAVFDAGPAALFLEVGFDQAQSVNALFTEILSDRWLGWRFWTLPDLRGIARIVAGERLPD